MRTSGAQRPTGLAWLMIAAALGWLALVVVLPLATVFVQAFSKGLATYLAALADPDARASIKLTLEVAAVAVPLNALFGIAAAW